MSTGYQAVIGLEVHAQLLTESKLFCACAASFGCEPNSNVCPVCLGLPGALPVLNERAVELALSVALALGCQVNTHSVFARKHYFYPDLPKGYQISQFERPLAEHGQLELALAARSGGPQIGTAYSKRVGITRIHLEEDAGKNIHGRGGSSLLDLNRAGIPLIEIVGAPDLSTAAEAAAYLRGLREILMFLGVNDGNLEEGSFRCDANVSIQPRGSLELGTRTELKNLNSFRFVQQAIEQEIARQTAVVAQGGQVVQETRSFNPASRQTQPLRTKEDSHDYRYFPEPDLPPLVLSEGFVAEQREALVELPASLRRRWQRQLGLSEQACRSLSGHPRYAEFFQAALGASTSKAAVKLANWIQTEILRGARTRGLKAELPLSPQQLASLVDLLEAGAINVSQAKEVYAALQGTEQTAAEIIEARGMQPLLDEAELLELLERVLAQYPSQAQEYQSGKTKLLGFLIGQVLKHSGGAADPKQVSRLLQARLEPQP